MVPRHQGFESDIARHSDDIAEIETRLTEVEPVMETWTAWAREHGPELDCFDDLGRQVADIERINRDFDRRIAHARELEQGRDQGLGMEL